MTGKDHSPPWTAKARTVALVSSVAVMVAVGFLLMTGRHPKATASLPSGPGMEPASHPFLNEHASSRRSAAGSTGTVEVCGYGALPIDNSDPSAIYQRIGALTKGARTRWLSALQNSDDLRARVAGLLLEGKVTGGEPPRPVSEQTRNEVVQLAAGGADPAVYAMAVSMCDTSAGIDPESACRQLSLQRWAQMDSGNAVPWLWLADQARASRDGVAEADAFRHAAQAHEVDSYSDSLLAFTEPELPQDTTPLERAYLSTEVIGVEAAMQLRQYSVASQHCSRDAIRDGSVRQQCDALAELFVTKGTNLLALGLGRSIGERVGWPTRRVNELAEEQHALMQAIMEQTPSDDATLWTCDAVDRHNANFIQRVRLGELGAARDALERSGETTQAMAQKYAQYREDIRRDALKREQEASSEDAP